MKNDNISALTSKPIQFVEDDSRRQLNLRSFLRYQGDQDLVLSHWCPKLFVGKWLPVIENKKLSIWREFMYRRMFVLPTVTNLVKIASMVEHNC